MRVEGQDRLIETVLPPLMFGDQLRLEFAVAVTRDLDIDFRVVGLDSLSGRAVAEVAAIAPRGVVLLITEQMSQFAIEGAFNEGFAEIFEEVFNLSGRLADERESSFRVHDFARLHAG